MPCSVVLCSLKLGASGNVSYACCACLSGVSSVFVLFFVFFLQSCLLQRLILPVVGSFWFPVRWGTFNNVVCFWNKTCHHWYSALKNVGQERWYRQSLYQFSCERTCRTSTEASVTGKGGSTEMWRGKGAGTWLSKLGGECRCCAVCLCRGTGEVSGGSQLFCSWRGLPMIPDSLDHALRWVKNLPSCVPQGFFKVQYLHGLFVLLSLHGLALRFLTLSPLSWNRPYWFFFFFLISGFKSH